MAQFDLIILGGRVIDPCPSPNSIRPTWRLSRPLAGSASSMKEHCRRGADVSANFPRPS